MNEEGKIKEAVQMAHICRRRETTISLACKHFILLQNVIPPVCIQCLYSFFCYVAWVTFGRRDLRGIQQEVGRLLRSDTFNPARRTRQEDPGESRDHDSLSFPNLSGPTAKEGQAEVKDQGHPSPALEQRWVEEGCVCASVCKSKSGAV